MKKTVNFFASFNNETGYGIHATKLAESLEKLIPLRRNPKEDMVKGSVNLTLMDSVSIQNVNARLPYPSILYNVWESTEQPDWFMDRLKYFDQLWVPSEWQKACSVAQGIPEEFVKVVPEGVDPEIFKPMAGVLETFNFLHIGQWQPRKSTIEICRAFINAFPNKPDVRLYLAADTNFPSDSYKSTEERLDAYGVQDSRIRSVPFEDHLDDEKIMDLFGKTHCFVSCSRSEGWGMPMCLAMACGIPTIVADWGGSQEYAGDDSEAIQITVPELKKPEGIFGDWNVPGEWGEPSYDELPGLMTNIFENYKTYKEKAVKDSDRIRTKFSWDAAAKTARNIIRSIPLEDDIDLPIDEMAEIRIFARKRGYEIQDMHKIDAIFVVDCWPSSQAKLDTLIETIHQIHSYGYPVLVTSHYSLPAPVIQLADFYLYEKQDIMSGDDKPVYWRKRLDGTTETAPSNNEYQGVAALNCFRNAIDFCRNRYEWIYQMSADMEVDLQAWLNLVHKASKPMVCIPYEGVKNGFGGGLWAGRSEVLDEVIPRLSSWKQYADLYPDERFVAERWIYNYVATRCDIENNVEWIDIESKNRFDNVDRSVWKDDDFLVNFIDGAYLNIIGLSDREYDVIYSTPQDGEVYRLRQKVGMWSKPNIKYYKDWEIRAEIDGEVKFEEKIDLKGKGVLISIGSKALGDTLAWIPYVEEFRKKHECRVVCASWWNTILDYPDIEFVNPGTRVDGILASYSVGCYDNQLDKNPVNWRLTTLQKVSADILGVDYKPIKPRLKVQDNRGWRIGLNDPLGQKPYVCFSEFSTMQNKTWNREGAWQEVIDDLNKLGYDCVSVSTEPTQLENVIKHNGQSIEQSISDIAGADFYVGLNHGPIWLAYALNTPAVMITGVSEEWNDFPNPYRISTEVCTPGCFNDPSIPIDRDWNWCPREKNYECTRSITPAMVIDTIEGLISGLKEFANAGNDKEDVKGQVYGKDASGDKKQGNNPKQSRVTKAPAKRSKAQ